MIAKTKSKFLLESDKRKRYAAVKRGDGFAVVRGGEVIDDSFLRMSSARKMADELNGVKS